MMVAMEGREYKYDGSHGGERIQECGCGFLE